MTTYRGGPLQSSIPDSGTSSPERKPFHILSTSFLEGNEVLVNYSDGSAAIFEAEELEKLRPKPKQIIATSPMPTETPLVLELAKTAATGSEREHPLVLGGAVA